MKLNPTSGHPNLFRQSVSMICATLVSMFTLASCSHTFAQSKSIGENEQRVRAKRVQGQKRTDLGQENKTPAKTQFLKIRNDKAGNPIALQTAITRYRPKEGELVVDLVGAVHIGEGEYYQTLNRQFKQYDVVLYELVAPQGTRIPKGGRSAAGKGPSSPLDMIRWMQEQAQSQLGLESQLKMIDYQQANFTHADLSPQQMAQKMKERGDTPLTIGLSAISEMLREQNRSNRPVNGNSGVGSENLSIQGLMELLDNPVKLKQMMARQFIDTGVMDIGMGASLNQLIITDRNVAALKVLQKEVIKGKKKIAVFYGAAHMPDFEKRLSAEFGLTKTKQVWVDAWDLQMSGKQSAESETTKLLLGLLNELGK